MSTFNNFKIISRNEMYKKMDNNKEKSNKTYGGIKSTNPNFTLLNLFLNPNRRNKSKYNIRLFHSKQNIKSSSAIFNKKIHKKTQSFSNIKNNKKVHITNLVKYAKPFLKPRNSIKKLIINELEKNTINYFTNSFNISYKNPKKSSACKQSKNNSCKKNINNIGNLKYIFKNNKINFNFSNLNNKNNHIKQNSENTTNANNTFNCSVDNNIQKKNLKIVELLKEKEKIKRNFDKENKKSKKYIQQINELKIKNIKLSKLLSELKIEQKENIKILNKSMKLIDFLQRNGLDIHQIIKNISFSEDYEESESDEDKKETKVEINYKKSSDNNNDNDIYNNIHNDLTEVSYGKLETHKEFCGSKFPSEIIDNIPKLKIKNIYKNNYI